MERTGPNTKEAMKALVRQCEGGRVIYRAKFGASWLCDVRSLEVTDDMCSVTLAPLRRIDTAMWRQEKPSRPFRAYAPWDSLNGKAHAILCTGYVNWHIIFDQGKVQEIQSMAEAPKMPVGDILSILRGVDRD